MSKPTIYIITGFAEGSWHTKRFYKTADTYGFKAAKNIEAADIIISHSAGCFYLPPANKRQLTILINPPYWPGKSMFIGGLQKFKSDVAANIKRGTYAYWLQKSFWDTLYLLGSMSKAIQIVKNSSRHDFYKALRQRSILIIRNDEDTFLNPDAAISLKKHMKFKYSELPGQHDDCWLDATPYIKVIQSVI